MTQLFPAMAGCVASPQAVSDGNGTMYVVMQDAAGSVTVVDTRAMKAVAHNPLDDKDGCNGLAFDAKNRVLTWRRCSARAR